MKTSRFCTVYLLTTLISREKLWIFCLHYRWWSFLPKLMRMTTRSLRLQFANFNICNTWWPLGFDHDIFEFISCSGLTIIAKAHDYIIGVAIIIGIIGKSQSWTFGSISRPMSPERRVILVPLKSRLIKIRQNERSSAKCSLNVNKVSRIFFTVSKLTWGSKVWSRSDPGGLVMIPLDKICSLSWSASFTVSGFSIAFTLRFLEKKLKQHRLRDMLVLKGDRAEGWWREKHAKISSLLSNNRYNLFLIKCATIWKRKKFTA